MSSPQIRRARPAVHVTSLLSLRRFGLPPRIPSFLPISPLPSGCQLDGRISSPRPQHRQSCVSPPHIPPNHPIHRDETQQVRRKPEFKSIVREGGAGCCHEASEEDEDIKDVDDEAEHKGPAGLGVEVIAIADKAGDEGGKGGCCWCRSWCY